MKKFGNMLPKPMFLQEKQIEKAGVHQFPMSTFQKYEQRKFTCIV